MSIDFVEGLPKSEGKSVVLVVVDKLTKFGHFISMAHPYTAPEVARLLLDSVVNEHGLPPSISNFWRELFKQLGVGLHMSVGIPSRNCRANRNGESMPRDLPKMHLLF